MPERRREVRERGEHEAAQMEPGMRKRKTPVVDDRVAIEEQVEIERARTFGYRALPPEPGFDVEADVEQVVGTRKRARQLDDAVEKVRLVEIIDGLGLVDRRESRPRGNGVEQVPYAVVEHSRPVAEVRPEANVRGHELGARGLHAQSP